MTVLYLSELLEVVNLDSRHCRSRFEAPIAISFV